jgi:cytochrome c oxidase subunit II
VSLWFRYIDQDGGRNAEELAVQKWWSVLFGAVLLACFALGAVAPIMGWWLPSGVSSYSKAVDDLFYLILGLTTVFFVLTQVILVVAMYRFTDRPANVKPVYTHGSYKLELLWTIIPGVLLVFIAYIQINVWNEIKLRSRMDVRGVDQVVQVTARQWEWRMRYKTPDSFHFADMKVPTTTKDYEAFVVRDPYARVPLVEGDPRAWGEAAQMDDLRGVNELHTWLNADVKVYLKTTDVIHSFFLPHLRLKQDALPGKTIEVWFKVIDSNCHRHPETGEWVLDTVNGEDESAADGLRTKQFELTCAELCGGRHYAMRGQLFVHRNKTDYLAWYKQTLTRQSFPLPPQQTGH